MSDEKTISLDEYERDNLLWLVRCAGRLHLNTGDWVYMVRAKLEAIGGNPDNANWPPSMTEAHVQGINDMRTALATATAERDALRGEVEGLKADLGAAQATADDRFKWRHVVERETAEAIAAFVDTEAEARREEGFSYRAVSELAADIRSGSWRKESK